ncbi:MAG: type II toxin-antitoxin system HicB family antitoxin [Nitrososphaerota archaeon]|nr:type II toxin-antitoxin system HicB family antitoxin [Nitrososphaerota archaeon]MDG6939458.1 type II toxin-antitoxin system HicB family antitoxin [Nitrososphaerota archaeon]
MKFTAVVEPAEEGGYVVRCVELPVATQAETEEKALSRLREAIEGYVEVRSRLARKLARKGATKTVALTV